MLRSLAPSQRKKSKKNQPRVVLSDEEWCKKFNCKKCVVLAEKIDEKRVSKLQSAQRKSHLEVEVKDCYVLLTPLKHFEAKPDPDIIVSSDMDEEVTEIPESDPESDPSQSILNQGLSESAILDEQQDDSSEDEDDFIPPTPEQKARDDPDDDCDIIPSSQGKSTISFNRTTRIQSFYEYSVMESDDEILRKLVEEEEEEDVEHIQDSTPQTQMKKNEGTKIEPPEVGDQIDPRTEDESRDVQMYVFETENAPTVGDVEESLDAFGLPHHRHEPVTCSKKKDVPDKGIDLGLHKLKLCWKEDLPPFGTTLNIQTLDEQMKNYEKVRELIAGTPWENEFRFKEAQENPEVVLESVTSAPMRSEIQTWLKVQSILLKEGAVGNKDEVLAKPDVDVDADSNLNTTRCGLRIRKDSEDSEGSDDICVSPPSPVSQCSSSSNSQTEKRTSSSSLSTHPNGKRKRSCDEESSPDCGAKEESDDEDPDFLEDSTLELREKLLKSQFRRKFEPKVRRILSYERSSLSGTSPNSPIDGPSRSQIKKNSFECLQQAKSINLHNYITVMSMELHVKTRQKLLPDPEFDQISAIFFLVSNDVPETSSKHGKLQCVYVLDPDSCLEDSDSQCSSVNKTFLISGGIVVPNVKYFKEESQMLFAFAQAVKEHDPEILVGYEVQMASWGYLIERANHLDINMAPLLSRMPDRVRESKLNEEDVYSASHTSELQLVGRIVLNLWRILRHEVSFYSYTFENMMYHVLKQRVPLLDHATLTLWWNHRTALYRWRVVDYFLIRINGSLDILDNLDIIGRTSELARVFGIQFYEVLSRGSQFRVESLMLRLTKRRNYVAVSPNMQQRAKMKAPEYIPLVMEPESRFYSDPVIVLDFQSLYPSIIMAYNYCYSTCLGRVKHFGKKDPYEFGCTNLKVSPQRFAKLEKYISYSPGGIGFVKREIREGVLPQMLKEILDTRFMVKRSMKIHKDDKALQRVLHSRQLGLKLIANVTYGYTSANFSGRMPCMEVGDSVVSKGRETLERCIKMIDKTPRFGAKVVYGDTDSVFVLLKGKSKEEAFRIGEEIAKLVTEDNPKPVKLKFEKVYFPCILQTKKRYVGYMYETVDQKEPVYDAKGIETVRRDGCPAVVKILERSLRILFETKDVSIVKSYVQRQFRKVMQNKASLQDLTFAKEFRGMNGYRPAAVVPALELARKAIRFDRRAIPRCGERVPYVIIFGEPGKPLIQAVRSIHEVMNDENLRPNATYYITKVLVPPLNRCFSLVGVDVLAWYLELPKLYKPRLEDPAKSNKSKTRGQKIILNYFASQHCSVCSRLSQKSICDKCTRNPQFVVHNLTQRIHKWDKVLTGCEKICRNCTQYPGNDGDICISLDCPVLYRKKFAQCDAKQIAFVQKLLENF